MATPSALSRIMQMVNPLASPAAASTSGSSLAPIEAGRAVFANNLNCKQSGVATEEGGERVALEPQAQAQQRQSPAHHRRLSSASEAKVPLTHADPLPLVATQSPQSAPFAPRSPSAGPGHELEPGHGPLSGLAYPALLAWHPQGDAASERSSGTGMGLREGRASSMAHLPDASPASLDAHAARLIRSLGLEDAFYILDVGTLNRLFLAWQAALPRVAPFYAVKCNPSPVMLSVLEALGAGFDCASEAEIRQVLSLGVAPERIIFANPCKMPSHIKFAAQHGVARTTFDSEAELDKIQALYPEAKLLLRIQTRDSGARCPLGSKYGALPEEVEGLLEAAAQRNLHVEGVSFHVGSGASDASAYHSAIAAAHEVFQMAAAADSPMTLLDIGGGFTAPRDIDLGLGSGPREQRDSSSASGMSFMQAAHAINAALDEFFPTDCGVSIIAEPGRYFAEAPSTLVARVFGKRLRGQQREYWINDGLYGSMNCTLYDHAVLSARPLLVAPSAMAARRARSRGISHSALSEAFSDEGEEGQEEDAALHRTLEQARVGSGFYDATGGGGSYSAHGLESGLPQDLNLDPEGTYLSTVFGPTCDGLDVVFRGLALPELEMGDWLIFPNMGAYTAAAGSSFNGFATSQLAMYLVFSSSTSLDTASSTGGRRTSSCSLDGWASPAHGHGHGYGHGRKHGPQVDVDLGLEFTAARYA